MQFEFEHVMHQPVERVFAYLGDPRNRPKWQRTIREFEMISEGEPRVGMKWRERAVGAPPFTMEITQFEPNRRWAERGESKAVDGELTLHFTSEGETTRLRVVIGLELKGFRKIAGPFIRLIAPGEIRRDLGRAESLIADGASAPRFG